MGRHEGRACHKKQGGPSSRYIYASNDHPGYPRIPSPPRGNISLSNVPISWHEAAALPEALLPQVDLRSFRSRNVKYRKDKGRHWSREKTVGSTLGIWLIGPVGSTWRLGHPHPQSFWLEGRSTIDSQYSFRISMAIPLASAHTGHNVAILPQGPT